MCMSLDLYLNFDLTSRPWSGPWGMWLVGSLWFPVWSHPIPILFFSYFPLLAPSTGLWGWVARPNLALTVTSSWIIVTDIDRRYPIPYSDCHIFTHRHTHSPHPYTHIPHTSEKQRKILPGGHSGEPTARVLTWSLRLGSFFSVSAALSTRVRLEH